MPESAIPPYITSLIRHFEDLRDGRHGGSATRNKSRADLSNPITEECCQSIQLYLAVGPLTRKLYRSETDRYRQVLVLYLKRPRAKSWELRRCLGALQIQRLEGSRPGGLWDLYPDEPVLVVCECTVAVRALGF